MRFEQVPGEIIVTPDMQGLSNAGLQDIQGAHNASQLGHHDGEHNGPQPCQLAS